MHRAFNECFKIALINEMHRFERVLFVSFNEFICNNYREFAKNDQNNIVKIKLRHTIKFPLCFFGFVAKQFSKILSKISKFISQIP